MAAEDRGIIKGKSALARLFKIDVVSTRKTLLMGGGQPEMQLILHFVNKSFDPMGHPDIKRYVILRADEPATKQFLALLQKEAKERSKYYK